MAITCNNPGSFLHIDNSMSFFLFFVSCIQFCSPLVTNIFSRIPIIFFTWAITFCLLLGRLCNLFYLLSQIRSNIRALDNLHGCEWIFFTCNLKVNYNLLQPNGFFEFLLQWHRMRDNNFGNFYFKLYFEGALDLGQIFVVV